jgi:hypothetical protein
MKAMHLAACCLNDADAFVSGDEGQGGSVRIGSADREPVGRVDGARQHADHDAGRFRLRQVGRLDGQNVPGRAEAVSNEAQHGRSSC